MADPGHRVAIAVAIIGVVGTLGAAFIGNWDKIFGRAPQAPVVAEPAGKPTRIAVPAADPTPKIAGVWRDSAYPGNGSNISQDGSTFKFTRWGALPNGVRFESSGTGRLAGSRITSRYTVKYRTGDVSSGECKGSVSPDATRIELSCSDSLLGTFTNIANRE